MHVHMFVCVGDGVTPNSSLVHQSLPCGRTGDLGFI